jgi:hypothetical protein
VLLASRTPHLIALEPRAFNCTVALRVPWVLMAHVRRAFRIGQFSGKRIIVIPMIPSAKDLREACCNAA